MRDSFQWFCHPKPLIFICYRREFYEKAVIKLNLLEAMRSFNVIVLRDHVQCGGVAEGRVLVGRNAIYQKYGLGQTLTTSVSRADLLVKEKMYIRESTNYAGNSVLEKPLGNQCYQMTHGNYVFPQPIYENIPNIRYLKREAESLVQSLFLLPETGTSYYLYRTLTFSGQNACYNLFSIDFPQNKESSFWEELQTINFVVPADTTIIINVRGSYVCLDDYRFYWNGLEISKKMAANILWNFGESQVVLGREGKMKGTILAPQACFWGESSICGTVVVKDLVGSMTAKLPTFQGYFPAEVKYLI